MGKLIIALGKPSKDEGESDDSPEEESAEKSAAQDLIDAIKSGDAESVALAFKAMMDAC
jgi:hypothetical protein